MGASFSSVRLRLEAEHQTAARSSTAMKSTALRVTLLLLLIGTRHLWSQSPQNTNHGLVGTWTLVSVEQRVDSDKPVKVPGARGLLVFDNAGHMLEVVGRSNI